MVRGAGVEIEWRPQIRDHMDARNPTGPVYNAFIDDVMCGSVGCDAVAPVWWALAEWSGEELLTQDGFKCMDDAKEAVKAALSPIFGGVR